MLKNAKIISRALVMDVIIPLKSPSAPATPLSPLSLLSRISFSCIFMKESQVPPSKTTNNHICFEQTKWIIHMLTIFASKQANKSFCSLFSLGPFFLCARLWDTHCMFGGSLGRLSDCVWNRVGKFGAQKVSKFANSPQTCSSTWNRQICAWAANEFCCLSLSSLQISTFIFLKSHFVSSASCECESPFCVTKSLFFAFKLLRHEIPFSCSKYWLEKIFARDFLENSFNKKRSRKNIHDLRVKSN